MAVSLSQLWNSFTVGLCELWVVGEFVGRDFRT